MRYLWLASLLRGLSELELAATWARYWARGSCDAIVMRGLDGVLVETRRARFLDDAAAGRLIGVSRARMNDLIRRARAKVARNIAEKLAAAQEGKELDHGRLQLQP